MCTSNCYNNVAQSVFVNSLFNKGNTMFDMCVAQGYIRVSRTTLRQLEKRVYEAEKCLSEKIADLRINIDDFKEQITILKESENISKEKYRGILRQDKNGNILSKIDGNKKFRQATEIEIKLYNQILQLTKLLN